LVNDNFVICNGEYKLISIHYNFKNFNILNTPLYIARRMADSEQKVTGIVKKIAIASIALGITVMIIAVAVVIGFQSEIRNKVIGFGSHIQITSFDDNISYESQPINRHQPFLENLSAISGIKSIQVFATKPGVIKTDDEIHGIIFKGVGSDFSWDFFNEKITEGRQIEYTDSTRSDDIIISDHIAKLLQLSIDDDVFVYFIQDPPRVRRLSVAAIYDTGLEELDQLFILGDIGHLQRLNDWENNEVAGFEILLHDFKDLEEVNARVESTIPYDFQTRTIRQLYPQIFDWLALLDMNVYVIIFIMILVAGINMITTLLISVLEKTNMIGILKALGSDNKLVRKVFLYHAGFLIMRGMLWGNILGVGLLYIQNLTGIIKLDQASYFVSTVPVHFSLLYILLINLGTLVISLFMLILPSYIIASVSPVKAITFR